MKNLLLSTVFTVSTTVTFAQTNLNLETWTGADPTGWNLSSNAISTLGGPTTVLKETASPAEGLNSAHLIVAACPLCPTFGYPNPFPGVLIQSLSFTARPAQLTFKWKGTAATGDTCVIGASVSIGTGTVVGDALLTVMPGTNQTTWLTATIPFTYYSASTPDTIIIGGVTDAYLLTGSLSGSTNASTTIYFDDFVMSGGTLGTSILETTNPLILAYPNPTNSIINLNLLGTDANVMEVYDVAGNLIHTEQLNSLKTTLNIENYTIGLYFVKFYNNQHNYIGTTRFEVAK